MRRWAIYSSSGEISGVYSGPESEALLQPVGDEGVLPMPDELDDATAHVSGGAIVAKQPLPFTINATQITADGADEAVITSIPAGVSVTWPDGQTDEVTDGEVRFSVDLPGTYTLTFTAVPYLDQEVTIEALAAT